MSHVSVGPTSTEQEEILDSLENLAISGPNEGIYKITATTFGNREFGSGEGTITGSGTANYIPKWNSSSSIINSLIYDDGTNVSIGVYFSYEASTATLSIGGADTMVVNGTVITTRLQLHADDSALMATSEHHIHSDTAGLGAIQYFARSRGTEAIPTVVQSGDTLGEIYAVGYDGTDYATSAKISFEANGTPGSNDMPGRISFHTAADGSQTLIERGRFTNSGSASQLFIASYDGAGTNPASLVLAGNYTSNPTYHASLNGFYNNDGWLDIKKQSSRIMLFRDGSIEYTPGGLTGALEYSAFSIAQTWNTTGNPAAIKVNITNTASGATSRLIDLQIASTSQWAVNKDGTIIGNVNGGKADFSSTIGAQAFRTLGVGRENNSLTFEIQSGRTHTTQVGVTMLNSSTFTGTSSSFSGVSVNPSFVPTGAGSANFRTLGLAYTINNAAGAQTGTATGFYINATETSLNGMAHNLIDVNVSAVSKFSVTNTGIGSFASTVNVGAAGRLRFGGGATSAITSGTDGSLLLSNASLNDFDYLQFGGTTSSFSALERVSTGIAPRLADGSGAARWLEGQGTDVASASTITLGSGNTFELTGTTTVDLITSTNWYEGSKITLIANESVTINHATATSGADITILLAGAAAFNMTANDTLTLVYSSTTAGGIAWREISRAVI